MVAAVLRVTNNFCIRGKDVAVSRTFVAVLKTQSPEIVIDVRETGREAMQDSFTVP